MELDNKRIIVTFLMHLGDLILTTPFIHALRKAAPHAHITYLVDGKLKEVVDHNPYIDEVWTIDKKGKDNNIKALRAMSKRISEGNFDVLINLHPNERCSFIDAFAKVPVKVGASHFLFRGFFHPFLKLNRTIHAADMYLDVLKRIGVDDLANDGLEVFPSPENVEWVKKYWQDKGVQEGTKLIGFNIGSAVVTKRWPAKNFALVADTLAQEGYQTVFFGGKMDEELVKEATALMESKPIIATGDFTLGQLAAAMRSCSVIVTNDSGPMHMAISQKVPIVALYGPSLTHLYGPYTDKAIIVKAIPPCDGCKGGMKHQCDDLRCMRELKPEQVLEAVHTWLK